MLQRGMCVAGRNCISISEIICIRHLQGVRIRRYTIIMIVRRITSESRWWKECSDVVLRGHACFKRTLHIFEVAIRSVSLFNLRDCCVYKVLFLVISFPSSVACSDTHQEIFQIICFPICVHVTF
jgi:hypothetical protein